jgi:hypothetical protein
MSQYNVTQAEAFEQSNDEDQAQYGGHSVVAINATQDIGGPVINHGFSEIFASAMCIFFDCKVYSSRKLSSFEWTFYGIASNTAAAAMAFEMTYNLILNWSMLKKGTSAKHSYNTGVADGLYHLAQEEKREEMMKSKRNRSRNHGEKPRRRAVPTSERD